MPVRSLNVYVSASSEMAQLSARTGTTSPVVPGLRPTRPSMTWFMTYDELLSSMSAESVREMSPGSAAMSVPPARGVPGGPSVGAGVAAPVGAGVAAGVGDAPVVQAPTRRPAAMSSAPNRGRLILLLLSGRSDRPGAAP